MIALAGWIVWRAQGLRPGAVALALAARRSTPRGRGSCSGRKQITHALSDIIALWLAILAVHRRSPGRCAAPRPLLFVPYFLWVTFAAALNFEIWRLNS